jgi:hypothetical protein
MNLTKDLDGIALQHGNAVTCHLYSVLEIL